MTLARLAELSPFFLVGEDGMLGRAWYELLTKAQIPFRSARGGDVDIRDAGSIAQHLASDARTVVNCAAWTDVDGAELDEAAAHAVNASGVACLAARCRKLGATLVHYSTDYVFDGSASTPYRVEHPTRPINAYGRSKAAGERLLRDSGARHLLVRTSWLYAPWGKNFVRSVAALCESRERLRVVSDQRGRPTSAERLAQTTLALLAVGVEGPFHATDGGECSWFELAHAVARFVRPACRIEPCTSAEYPARAARPANGVLDLSATTALVGPPRHWTENVHDVLMRLAPKAATPRLS